MDILNSKVIDYSKYRKIDTYYFDKKPFLNYFTDKITKNPSKTKYYSQLKDDILFKYRYADRIQKIIIVYEIDEDTYIERKVLNIISKIPKTVSQRRTWKKFGIENNGDTQVTSLGKPVNIFESNSDNGKQFDNSFHEYLFDSTKLGKKYIDLFKDDEIPDDDDGFIKSKGHNQKKFVVSSISDKLHTIVIKNILTYLDSDYVEQEIENMFLPLAKPYRIKVLKNKHNRELKGIVFVDFMKKEHVDSIMNSSNKFVLDNYVLQIERKDTN